MANPKGSVAFYRELVEAGILPDGLNIHDIAITTRPEDLVLLHIDCHIDDPMAAMELMAVLKKGMV